MKILRPIHFQSQSPQTPQQKVNAAATVLKKLLPQAVMVQGTMVSGEPEIFIGFRSHAALEAAKSILVNTPHVTQDPKDHTLKYRGYPIRLFDGLSTL